MQQNHSGHVRFCRLVGLDPEQSLDLTLELNGLDGGGTLRWTGQRTMEPVEVIQLLAYASHSANDKKSETLLLSSS